jgi:non-ribosomal peptide synthetase component F
MVQDARLAAVVSQSSLAKLITPPAASTLLVDGDAGWIAQLSDTPLPSDEHGARPEDPAYVIYTSGSTGKPKGTLVPHRAVVNFLTGMALTPGLAREDTLLAVTTLSFDIAVLELLLPLTVGAQVVLASREEACRGRLGR